MKMTEPEAPFGAPLPAANDARPDTQEPAAPPEAAAALAEPAVPPPAEDFGSRLRAAREAAGLSQAMLANRMRLHIKQIEALERCDLAALPSHIYVRGFIRSCARELKIDPAPLLADLDARVGVAAGPEPVPSGAKFGGLSGLGDTPRPLVAAVLVLLVLAGLVGLLVPRHSTIVTPAPAPAAVAPVPQMPPAEASAGAGGVAAAPAEGASAPGAAPAAATAVPLSGGPAPMPSAPAPAAEAEGLVLHVHAPSWVEVVQADGTSVFSQVCQAGSEHEIHGKAPLSVVIGNAAAVEARYRGVPVDLAARTSANGVARLSLP